ncbi:MAG: DSD1 family PLP-dependent enzyme [Bermanella sp.]
MAKQFNKNRRKILLGGLAAGATAATWGIKPADIGENHSPYFVSISNALDTKQLAKPTLVVDKKKLLQNISVLKQHIGTRFDYRIVVKSLPSIDLVKLVMEESDSKKLMVFHQPFLTLIANEIPYSDVLMGKPMPVAAAAKFYQNEQDKPTTFKSEQQLQWLIDSPQRLNQYQALAASVNQKMNINIELDVGLHRGGVNSDSDLLDMLHLMEKSELLTFSGFMGYEPHIGSVPGGIESNRDKVMNQYRHYISLTEKTLGRSIQDLCLNSAGSPTYQLYDKGDFPQNELSAGTCLVKPTHYDLDTLADHIPASYIATPVIKSIDHTDIPGVDGLGDVMAAWDPNRAQTFFTYGGYWKAEPESPKGISVNPLFGRSTNQEMYNGSKSISLKQDDWIFMRPTQSEFVFLQFGDIALFENGEIKNLWPVFSESSV